MRLADVVLNPKGYVLTLPRIEGDPVSRVAYMLTPYEVKEVRKHIGPDILELARAWAKELGVPAVTQDGAGFRLL